MKSDFKSRHAIGALVEFTTTIKEQQFKQLGFITEVKFTEAEYSYSITVANTHNIEHGIGPDQVGKVYALDYGKASVEPLCNPAPAQTA